MPKVLISGGSGSIGRALCALLEQHGYDPCILSRSRKDDERYTTFLWDHARDYLENGALENCEHIIHLAGTGIADKRWTDSRKKEILNSRVETGALLHRKVREANVPLKSFVSASATGYYGQVSGLVARKEQDPPGDDFTAHTCKAWEAAADQFNELGIRTVKLRIGIVLMPTGGALEAMAAPVKLGFGSVLGSGKQVLPWIHLNDLVHILLRAVQDETMQGVYNACAPSVTSNEEFTNILAKVLQKRILLPRTPGWLLRLVLGERASLLLEGSPVSADKLLGTGFEFQYTDPETCIRDLLGN